MQPKEKMAVHSLALATLAVLLLSGCAAKQYAWTKPDLTQADFARDKYACVRDARSSASSAYLTGGYYVGNTYIPTTGGASSGEIVNENIFKPCMEAKGYALTAAQPSAAVQEVKAKLQAMNSQLKACVNALRSKPQYAALVPHLSDVATGAYTMAQLTDKSLATPAESQAVVAYTDELNGSCSNQYRASAKAIVPASGPIYEHRKTLTDNLVILLVEHKISWGEYAQRNKQTGEELIAQLNQVKL
jgi:hypothetical protein